MTQRAAVFFVRALTPVHIGMDIGLGAVNLPTMREAITEHPVIPGSSFKGVLRDLMELPKESASGDAEKQKLAAFGPGRAHASDYRGGLVLSDARLLLLPVASLKGTFAWTTSKTVLRRFHHDLQEAGFALPSLEKFGDELLVPTESKLLLRGNRVSLREVLATAQAKPEVSDLAQKLGTLLWNNGADLAFFKERFAVLPNDVFDALARWSLEIRARVAIDSERGTAEASGPWTEEHIPAETVLAGLAFGRKTSWRHDGQSRSFNEHEMLQVFQEQVGQGKGIRLGGHSSIGMGRVFLTCSGAK